MLLRADSTLFCCYGCNSRCDECLTHHCLPPWRGCAGAGERTRTAHGPPPSPRVQWILGFAGCETSREVEEGQPCFFRGGGWPSDSSLSNDSHWNPSYGG